ncbi:MAG: hypothetical protein J1F10_05180 [Muribaculaceae bacterium]|nr:hypothetical protein [Muribaculaceae bacterium]
MNKELSNIILSIRDIPLNEKLSDNAVIALMNIHLSLMNLIIPNMLEDEYGCAEFHSEAMIRSHCTSDYRNVDIIVEQASRLSEYYLHGSDEWLWCISVVLSHECMRVNEQIQNRIFAHSAGAAC